MKRIIFKLFILFLITTTSEALDLKGFKTDSSRSSIDLNKILSGGPGKDGIPAINKPVFNTISKSNLEDTDLGLFLDIDGIQKFYPFNILVWHEIVNDKISDNYISVTFCPLCGSGIVFNREFKNRVHKFGVSGLLYESNLLMYDISTESLWSQSKGESVVGKYTGYKLEKIPVNILEFKTVMDNYPKALILSTNTGFKREYGYNPYGDYDTNDKFYFPISPFDKDFHPKELMYVFDYNNKSYTFKLKDLDKNNHVYNTSNKNIMVKYEKGQVKVLIDKEVMPGYYEMWFSWFIHNSTRGEVLDIN